MVMKISNDQIIEQTRKWIREVVIGCNLCPFAAKVVNQNTVHFQIAENMSVEKFGIEILAEINRLELDANIETSFLIFPNSLSDFNEYLDMISQAEKLLIKNGYEGIYQIASFHPLYQFADSFENDAANYTNRSVYPMLHLLREESIEKALIHYESPENIPNRNINFTRKKGQTYMKMLRDSCLNS